MQTMPLIRELWPGHFFFHTHPILAGPLDDPMRQRWEAWSRFQVSLCKEAGPFYDAQLRGSQTSVAPFQPDLDLLEKAESLGVEWNIDGKRVTMQQDPFLFQALQSVRCRLRISSLVYQVSPCYC